MTLEKAVLVGYSNGAKEVCEAPYSCILREGTEVETDFGRGTVLCEEVVTKDEKLWLMIKKCMKISRIQYVLGKITYDDEEEENVISD